MIDLAEYIIDIFQNLKNIILSIRGFEIFEIAILTAIIFFVIRFIRDTRAEQLVKGIFIIAIILFVFRSARFKVLGELSGLFLNAGIVAVAVMFQPELRRAMEKMGRSRPVRGVSIFNRNSSKNPGFSEFSISYLIDEISLACEKMSHSATGALIVIERETKLGEQIDTGTIVDSSLSDILIRNIFFKNSPLHDGAMIIRGGRVYAAGCFLPKPQSDERVPRELGTRHRAAVGMTEQSDSLVIVVSEETGNISLVENGIIKRDFNRGTLSELLSDKLNAKKVNLKKKPKNSKKELSDGV